MPEATHLIEINTLPRADEGNVLTPNATSSKSYFSSPPNYRNTVISFLIRGKYNGP